MTKQEFEYHLLVIKQDATMIERYKDSKDIVASHQESIQFHQNALNEFYDRHQEEEEPETLIYLQNKKDDIEFHLHWQCEPGSFEYQSYEEELQGVRRKIDELTKENGNG